MRTHVEEDEVLDLLVLLVPAHPLDRRPLLCRHGRRASDSRPEGRARMEGRAAGKQAGALGGRKLASRRRDLRRYFHWRVRRGGVLCGHGGLEIAGPRPPHQPNLSLSGLVTASALVRCRPLKRNNLDGLNLFEKIFAVAKTAYSDGLQLLQIEAQEDGTVHIIV